MSDAVAPPKKRLVKRPPARKQVEHGQIDKKQPEQSGTTLNIWYNKWAGGDKYDSYNAKEKSQTRVNIKKDSGWTKADAEKNPYLCMFFARGQCPYGHECSFLHRLPPKAHELPDSSRDVFGREKHSGYRDDMGGVGAFTRQNRTLYIGRLIETRDTADVVERHFEEFGEIERIRILTNRGVAFVTYVNELNAQFAKEAMMHQSLDNDEVLNVRWATEDPNPKAKIREAKEIKQQGEDGIVARLDPEFVQAVREMDEFEGIVDPRQPDATENEEDGGNDDDEEDEAENGRASKRARIEAPPTSTGPKQPVKPVQASHPAPVPASVPAPEPKGILSANALDSLKVLAAIRPQVPVQQQKAQSNNALGGLAAYGSDEDD
ncbi:Pre-mRNA-splicing factor [Microbotryomycetes sp. JL221]|nr:Pre-mRNA-splicing factor [Microbotryomycetes sp. JL221]